VGQSRVAHVRVVWHILGQSTINWDRVEKS